MTEIQHHVLIEQVSTLIEHAKSKVISKVNHELVLLFWQIGHVIHQYILQEQRAEYGKQTIINLAEYLTTHYGRNFSEKNLRRMVQFCQVFDDLNIVAPLARQLTWSHFLVLIPLKSKDARLFYAQLSVNEQLSKRKLKEKIENKVFERTEIANVQLNHALDIPKNTFKDPYLLDFLNLNQGYLENDLENAILLELEKFLMELGNGFAFIERQKRMIIDGEDFYLDLLFYHRKLQRLIAIELKLGKFKAQDKGQMELYLNWLNQHERQNGENYPIGLILCAESSREQIELLQMHKDNILVAEYWTQLPEKALLEQKLHQTLLETKYYFEQQRLLNMEPL